LHERKQRGGSSSSRRIQATERFKGSSAVAGWKPYNMSVCHDNDLFAAAGSRGLVGLFSRSQAAGRQQQEQEQDDDGGRTSTLLPQQDDAIANGLLDPFAPPQCVFQAHSRWVSATRFVASATRRSLSAFFLTTSDDGTMKLFNAERCYQAVRAHPDAAPEPIVSCAAHMLHNGNGIYDMALSCGGGGSRIATCGKDAAVMLHRMTASSIVPRERVFRALHSQVVKSVAWRDKHIFASTGNDKRVCIVDVRLRGDAAACVASLDNAHALAVNTVRWRRGALHDSHFMTSSFDKRICMHDMRMLSRSPLFSCDEHWPKALHRTSSISHPCFLERGAFIVAAGTRQTLSVFSASSGALLEQLPLDVSLALLCELPETVAKKKQGQPEQQPNMLCCDSRARFFATTL
jgi:WD40 repeat protein